MTEIKSPFELIRGISLFDLKSFLKSKDWKEIVHRNRKLSVFHGPKNDAGVPLELFLPRSDNFEDFDKRMYDVFLLISNLYEIEPSILAGLLKCFNRDNFFIKISPNDKSLSSIPLELAKKEVNGIRNLFVYSACSEKNALPHHNYPSTVGYQMAEKIRFGHTFQGSFGFSIETPVIEEFKQQGLFSPPIERKVIERIVRGIKNTTEAVSKKDPEILVANFSSGFNSRMCEAIVEMGEALEIPVELSVQWATNLPPTEDVSDFKSKTFGDEEISYLKYAAEKLKEVSPEKTLIIGKVVNLHSNDPTSEDGKRTIILKHYHEEYGNIDVRIELGISQYLQAIEAHKSRELLEVQGFLERKGSVWLLEAVSDLKVLKDK
ncbi:MAG: hypothetical protein ABFS18_00520 [Thermodesulfobacteriota bacterium]